MAWVDIQNFSYTYPDEKTPVLKNINLSIDRGAFVVITGKSGCGKSTLGKALAGFLFHDEVPQFSGEIFVNGTDMTQLPLYDASSKVSYVQQNPEDQFCTLSVMDEIAFALENNCFNSNEIYSRIDHSLSIVNGLSLKNRELATLSGGEKQKVAIASMLALSPDVLILDEPTSNLDPIATQNIFETLHHLRGTINPLTVIIIEHKLSQLLEFQPEIFLLEKTSLKSYEYHMAKPTSNKKRFAPLQNKQRKYSSKETPIVKLTGLNIEFGSRSILTDINITLKQGEFVALMGPNGSGKSTLLQTIMGFNENQARSGFIFGKEIKNLSTSTLVSDAGFIFQNPDHQLFTQSVWEETTLTSELLGVMTAEKEIEAKSMLEQMGLGDRLADHPQRLSYGEKRRLNLAAILLHEPKLLLIDEFLIGQDSENAHTWMSFLQAYVHQGNSVILVNHHADLTMAYCNRVIFLEKGKIIVDLPAKSAFDKLESLGFTAFLPHCYKAKAHA